MSQKLAHLAINFLLREDHFVDAVIVPLIVRCHLVEPLGHTCVDVTCHDGHGPTVVTRTLCRVPRGRVTCTVVHQVFFQIRGIPAPCGAATDHPLVAFPGVCTRVWANRLAEVCCILGISQNVAVRTHGIRAPCKRTVCDVVRGYRTTNTEFTTGNTDDDFVFHRQNCGCVGFTDGRIAVYDGPFNCTCVCIQRNNSSISLVQEDFAFCVCYAAVNGVTAHDRNNVRVLLGLILPLDLAFVGQVQSINNVRERRVQIHCIANNQRRTFVTAQNAGRECPCNLQVAHVFRIDLVQLREALVFIIAGLDGPLVGVCHISDETVICCRHRRAKCNPGCQKR